MYIYYTCKSDIKVTMWYYLPKITGLKCICRHYVILILIGIYKFLKSNPVIFQVFFFNSNCLNLNFMKWYLLNLSKSITTKFHLCFYQHSFKQCTYLKSFLVTIGAVSDWDDGDGDGDVQTGQAVCVGIWYFSL